MKRILRKEQLERQLKWAIKAKNRSKAAWCIVELERLEEEVMTQPVYWVRPSYLVDDAEEVYYDLEEAKIAAQAWATELSEMKVPEYNDTYIDVYCGVEKDGERTLETEAFLSYLIKFPEPTPTPIFKPITPIELACFRETAQNMTKSSQFVTLTSEQQKSITRNSFQWNTATLYGEGIGVYYKGKCVGAYLADFIQNGKTEVIYLTISPEYLYGKMGIRGFEKPEMTDVYGNMIRAIISKARQEHSQLFYDCYEDDRDILIQYGFEYNDIAEAMTWSPPPKPLLQLVA